MKLGSTLDLDGVEWKLYFDFWISVSLITVGYNTPPFAAASIFSTLVSMLCIAFLHNCAT